MKYRVTFKDDVLFRTTVVFVEADSPEEATADALIVANNEGVKFHKNHVKAVKEMNEDDTEVM